MTSKKTYIRIGLFVVTLTTALIWGALWLSAGGAPGEFDFYTTYMNESVSGLSPDAALTYRGVNVGKVREITIDPNNPNRVRLLLQVKHGVPIKQDTEATLGHAGSDRPRHHRPARRIAGVAAADDDGRRTVSGHSEPALLCWCASIRSFPTCSAI